MAANLGHQAFHLMRKLIQEHTALWQSEATELTKPQFSVLLAISEKPGLEQAELMAASVSTKATLAEILGRMEKRGWILREAGTTDKRRKFVYLTEAGCALLQQAKVSAELVDNQFVSRLSEADQQTFIRLLNEMLSKSGS
ncbi:transcriptional regulator [Shewanella mangrovi]|uniref:Transcriptional regulator n=1 Tax=Shewanella mangrovi TaxID=1515746 RepID=A0A094K2N7_9GAMM|nr:MarR family transcriptional regulator [Shewanella mangrovi]KFZ38926.1 transcriptional regulator [Shewanella mangrovi]